MSAPALLVLLPLTLQEPESLNQIHLQMTAPTGQLLLGTSTRGSNIKIILLYTMGVKVGDYLILHPAEVI